MTLTDATFGVQLDCLHACHMDGTQLEAIYTPSRSKSDGSFEVWLQAGIAVNLPYDHA